MRYSIKLYRKELICTGVVFLLLMGGLCAGIWKQSREPVDMLERPEWGEGEIEKALIVENETGEQKEIKVEVREREYTKSEKADFLDKVELFVKKEALKENEGWDSIKSGLRLVESMPLVPVEIYWDLGEAEYFDRQGNLLFDKIPMQGGETSITAVLLCEGERRDVEIPLKILPPVWTKEELWLRSVEENVQKMERQFSREEKLRLPAWIENQKVVYYDAVSGKAGGKEWFLFSVAAGVLLYAGMKKEEKEKRERIKKQLLAEYPVLTEKLLLFMGAGMSIRNIFFRLCEESRERLFGEELKRACKELKNGEPEGQVYIRFGERIGLLPYVRLGALLSQNLRSGTREIMEFLERERRESFYARKETARQRGEEIGVKAFTPYGDSFVFDDGSYYGSGIFTILVLAFLAGRPAVKTVKGKEGMERIKVSVRRKRMKELKAFLQEEDGVGVVEIILILVILIGLVLMFKEEIGKIIDKAFKSIRDDSGKILQ